MPEPRTKDELPDPLKPYTFLGIELDYVAGRKQAIGTCPFCNREQKLHISPESGQWDCKVCSDVGNVYTFLRRFYDACEDREELLNTLAEDRKIPPSVLKSWGIKFSFLSDDVIIPGYGADGKLNTLYRRMYNYLEKRWYLNGPKGIGHQLFGVPLYNQDKDDVFFNEGIWDGSILWHTLGTTKYNSESGAYLPTANPDLCLLKDANVLATPSANVFHESWTPLFAGKRVYLCYDNDHPAKKSGLCGALEGMRRAATILTHSSNPPKEIHYIKWGEGKSKSGAIGYNPDRKHGYDIRDLLSSSRENDPAYTPNRGRLELLFAMMEPVPPSWIEGAKGGKGTPIITPIACSRYQDVLIACGKALRMNAQMERGLSVMLACASLVEVGGDQLWIKFIGPPSSGKTTLAEGLTLARKYACMKSITTGLHSGYHEKGDDNDYSLMKAIKDMAVIIKDGDTLLQAESLSRILSELRDAYDRSSTTHFRNTVQREYLNHSFALLIFGTEAMRKLDQSELGQRFIDCVMMDEIDTVQERETNIGIGHNFRNLMASQITLNGEKTEGKDMLVAKQTVGGYFEHLRRNILHLISEVTCPDTSLTKLSDLAMFVALFRARPSSMQNEKHTRELSHRLMKQFSKLAYGLAVVLAKKEIDEEVMSRVIYCGLDTARGDTLKIAKVLYGAKAVKRTKSHAGKEEGMDVGTLATRINLEPRELRKLLIFLRGIKVIEATILGGKVGMGSRYVRWKLTDEAKRLYASILGLDQIPEKSYNKQPIRRPIHKQKPKRRK